MKLMYVINPFPNKITYLSFKNSRKYSISKEYNGLRGLYYLSTYVTSTSTFVA